ncbi:LuxR C-terminal-related transcriptional regulator [Herbiconiux moechotypicola]|uniref:HTH luxR-type domain-containing protein n=1 Tax=Herbiconiux moechotypicola TaxID=637393 RepID=A0ABN3DN61_9MICO|nr:LuxR C-terminal-related transcriptional regulator [Herbiconiux moechotypicola]MCS5730338.1 LuxR C-terminal-related transcriptional regulator [Herbiconiux moechotypicola]
MDTEEPGHELDRLVTEGRWDAVVAILDHRWGEVLSADPEAVKRAVNALPASVLEANPRWSLAANYVNRFVSNGQTPTTIFRGTSPTPEPVSLLDLLAGLTSKIAERRARGRYSDAVEAAAEARSLLDEADDTSRTSLRQALPEIAFQWGMAWEYAGDSKRAAQEYAESYDSAVAIDHRLATASAAGALAWLHAIAGRNIQARQWLDRLPPVGEEWWGNRAAVTARFARTQLLVDEFRLSEARAEAATISLRGVPERWPAQKYLLALIEDDPAVCLDLLTQIDSSAATLPADAVSQGAWSPFVAIARSVLLGRLGNWAAAREALDTIHLDERGTEFGALHIRLWKAAAALVTGDVARARRNSSTLIGQSTASPRVLVGALAVSAVAARRSGDEETAATHLDMAVALAAQHRLFAPLTVVPPAELRDLVVAAGATLPADVESALFTDDAAVVSDPDPFLGLTPRELAVVRSMVARSSVDEVSTELFVSRNTIKSQLRSAYRKLGVGSKAALEELALRHGYAPADE